MNERSWAIADGCVARATELRIGTREVGGARLIDAGIDASGGLAAGLALAEICMGGLGHAALAPLVLGSEQTLGLHVWTDHPAVACMASQYAGWAINPDGYFAMGSGPLRAKARVERELFHRLSYADDAARGVLVLEGRQPPTPDVVEWVASKAGLAPDALTLVIAPTASVAGSVQIVARVVEAGLHKLDTLGFDVTRVRTASGTAPLPPAAKNDVRAIGRTNDAILYGGQVRFLVDATDDELSGLAEQLPSSSSTDYGTPFREVFTRYGGDFYKIDPRLFSPAEVWLTSVASGRTFHGGRVAPDIVRASFFDD